MTYIVNVAIRQGRLFFCPVHPEEWRHHHLMEEMVRCGVPTPIAGEQGFVTDAGFFVDRRAALVIAIAAGQIEKKTGNPNSDELFSEDLW